MGARSLRKMMLLQEGILISIFFGSMLSFIVADRISRSQTLKAATPQHAVLFQKKTGEVRQIEIAKKNTSYDF